MLIALEGAVQGKLAEELDEDIKNIRDFYLSQGFAEVSVAAKVDKDTAARRVDIHFIITEGPRYQVKFEGNDHFWDHTLKKDVIIYKEGNKNNFGLRKSARNIQKRYQNEGYQKATVKFTVEAKEQKGRPVREVHLQIDEGPRSVVSDLNIEGNDAIRDQQIQKEILTRTPGIFASGGYVPQTLEDDVGSIKALYLKDGYTQATVQEKVEIRDDAQDKDKNRKSVAVTLAIDEGMQTKVKSVRFPGLSVLQPQDALDLITLKPGAVYRSDLIESDQNALAAKISEMGYPHIQVKGSATLSSDKSLAELVFTVDEGPYVTVGQIYFSGNFRTLDQTLQDELELKPGEPLSLTKLLESQRNILNVQALDSARFKALGLTEKAEQVDLLVEVTEMKPYFFEIGGGYDTERHFFLNSRIGDRNLFGRNLNLEAALEFSEIGYKGNIALTDPRLFTSLISSNSRLFAEESEQFNQDFGIRSYGASQDFYRKFFHNKLITNLGFRYEYREQYLTADRPITEDEADLYEPRSILVTSPSILFNSTDSFVRPRRGLSAAFYVDLSKGLDNDLDDFVKFRFDTRYYYPLLDPLTLAIRGRYGYIDPYGSNTTIPSDQLFFLGGTATVRGFDENVLRFDELGTAVGGREAILGSLEARYDLGMNFEFSTFYDVGSVRKAEGKGGLDDLRSSVGVGLRYMTPIGPIGLLYGWKLDRKEGEAAGRLHFSMG
ncbi:MAG: outer membrane protein assembly factor BamA, partial [Desulfobacterales bacterium]|nr:outer membrane protein assembly factor BamA [Desulfobacterales bacterium]